MATDQSKACRTCHEVKPLSGFCKNKGTRDGYFSDCRDCINAYRRRRGYGYPWSTHALNPKFRARRKLRWAVRAGIIIRPTVCPKCGTEAFVEGHHENYDEPYTVQWLCKDCHVELHGKRKVA